MRKILFVLSMGLATGVYAQIPEDAIRFSWHPVNGTARNMAIGGAMGSLGGDLSAAWVNPAGIGMYRNSEIVLSPKLNFNNYKVNYRGTATNLKDQNLSFGPMGVIIGGKDKYSGGNLSQAFAISLNKTADFNKSYTYNGLNNYSSYSEMFVEELLNYLRAGNSFNAVLNTQSPMPYTVAPAFYTYLIDSVTVNGQQIIKGAPEYLLDAGKALKQEKYVNNSGGIYELGLTAAANDGNKWLIGGTLGIPVLDYKSKTSFMESDTSAAKNVFESFTYTDDFRTTGIGANLKLGAIFRPQEFWRVGLAVHTPSYMLLSDTRTSEITTNLTPVSTVPSVSSKMFTNGIAGESEYTMFSPWKFMLSGSYVFREVEDITRQKGFVTLDVEYVTHGGSKYRSAAEEPLASDVAYYKELSNVIKGQYRGTLNARLGGEVKWKTLMARAGAAYYSNPYKDKAVKASQTLLSGGLGYRNKGFFLDLTYVYNMRKDADFPYRLQSRLNTFATEKTNKGSVVATLGIKL